MKKPAELEKVIRAAEETSRRLRIPADIVSLHGELKDAKLANGRTLQGPRQHQLRWATFLLAYAAIESFFNLVLCDTKKRQPTPLVLDKLQQQAKATHQVTLFSRDWTVTTLAPNADEQTNEVCVLRTYRGSNEIREYLADLKSLRDLLSHGNDPYLARNVSGALWNTRKGPSLRMYGVQGFLRAGTMLVEQTIEAFGGTADDHPAWEPCAVFSFEPGDR